MTFFKKLVVFAFACLSLVTLLSIGALAEEWPDPKTYLPTLGDIQQEGEWSYDR
jgi:hypothetical protein